MKKHKKIYCIITVTIVVTIIIRIIAVNREYPQVIYQDISLGNTKEWHDVFLTITDATIYDSISALDKYGDTILEGKDESIDYKVIEVEALVESTSNQLNTIYLYDLYLENDVYANGIAAEVQINSDTPKLDVDLQPLESKKVTLCYIVYENQFNKMYWDTFSLNDFWVSGDSYPIKNRWMLE